MGDTSKDFFVCTYVCLDDSSDNNTTDDEPKDENMNKGKSKSGVVHDGKKLINKVAFSELTEDAVYYKEVQKLREECKGKRIFYVLVAKDLGNGPEYIHTSGCTYGSENVVETEEISDHDADVVPVDNNTKIKSMSKSKSNSKSKNKVGHLFFGSTSLTDNKNSVFFALYPPQWTPFQKRFGPALRTGDGAHLALQEAVGTGASVAGAAGAAAALTVVGLTAGAAIPIATASICAGFLAKDMASRCGGGLYELHWRGL